MTATPAHAPLYELSDVTLSFGNVVAISGVTLDVLPGQVVGLVGDNGAGKSTLMKVMNGFHRPGSGVMRFKGEDVAFASPRDARRIGIETVYQDLALIPALSIWRNFFLGRERAGGIRPFRYLKKDEMRELSISRLRELGLTRLRSPDEPVDILSGGERQALAIARARFFGGSLLLLDEPASALSVKETEKVSEAIHNARKDGIGVVIIDHNIAHVHRICDKIVVLENGRVLKTVDQSDVTAATVADMVAGRHKL
ncbi:ATP-binding cassette domain-containing protein [Taklimakanibacter deserti]|uniref:ATP-binding cassette domain-containing protein n=1 Tax=Taklimakanibacter deserti TaxID=2267839 RepID=UPI000E659AA9